MAIDFPTGVPAGTEFTSAGVTWEWDGQKWVSQATGGGGSGMPTGGGTPPEDAFYENTMVIDEDYQIADGKNAGTFGPITVNSTITVPNGQTWTVVGGDGDSGLWTRSGTTISPANAGDSVKSAGPFWYDSTFPKAFNNTAFQASGSDGIGAIVTSIGTTLIGGDLDEPFGEMSPNITLAADGTINVGGYFWSQNADSTQGGCYLYNYDGNASRNGIAFQVSPTTSSTNKTVDINYDGSATFAGPITPSNVTFNLEPDNPQNWVSTTNAEGETESVYNGPTLDVKALLLEFQSKIETLEAAKAALEARITTLEGGSN
jgi:hypothetical protein